MSGPGPSSTMPYSDQGVYYQGTYQYFDSQFSPINSGDGESTGLVGSSPSSGVTSPAKSFDSFSPGSSFVSPPPIPPPASHPSSHHPQQRTFHFENDLTSMNNGSYRPPVSQTANGAHNHNFGKSFSQHSQSYRPPHPPSSNQSYDAAVFHPAKETRGYNDDISRSQSISSTNAHNPNHSSFTQYFDPQNPGMTGYPMQPNYSISKNHDLSSHNYQSHYPPNQHWNVPNNHVHSPWMDKSQCSQSHSIMNNHHSRPHSIPPFTFNQRHQSEMISHNRTHDEYYQGKQLNKPRTDCFVRPQNQLSRPSVSWNPSRQPIRYPTYNPRYIRNSLDRSLDCGQRER